MAMDEGDCAQKIGKYSHIQGLTDTTLNSCSPPKPGMPPWSDRGASGGKVIDGGLAQVHLTVDPLGLQTHFVVIFLQNGVSTHWFYNPECKGHYSKSSFTLPHH